MTDNDETLLATSAGGASTHDIDEEIPIPPPGYIPPVRFKPSLEIFCLDNPQEVNAKNKQCLFAIGVLPFEERYVLEFCDGPVVVVDEKTLINQRALCALLKCQLGRVYEPIDQEQWQLDLGRAFRELGRSGDLVDEYEQYLKEIEEDGGYQRWFDRQTDMFA
jgi:hypothetical protein